MILQTYTRGEIIEFPVTFRDASGEEVDPSSAVVKVNFLNAQNARETVAIDMESTTAGWSADWDSSVALPARVHWSAISVSPASAEDGAFELEANLANLGTVE